MIYLIAIAEAFCYTMTVALLPVSLFCSFWRDAARQLRHARECRQFAKGQISSVEPL